MSTGADCHIEEREPGKWYYKIQQYPYGATEDYDKHGPFSSFGAVQKHMDRHYANPGGYSVTCLTPQCECGHAAYHHEPEKAGRCTLEFANYDETTRRWSPCPCTNYKATA